MGGLARQGSGGWRRRGLLILSPVPRHSLLSPSSALLAAGGGKRGSKFKRFPAATSAAACLTALLMLGRILSPASAQVVYLSCNASYFGEKNWVEYNGSLYRTLDGDVSPWDPSGSKHQNYYVALPSGWALAADNTDSLTVIRSYVWGTHYISLATGNGYWTLLGPSMGPHIPGTREGTNFFDTSGSTYRARYFNTQILISKTGSACTACPAGESEIAQRECGGRVCV
jgi:hypothetical protein